MVVSTRSLGPACNVRAIDLRGERLSRFHKFSSIPKPSAARTGRHAASTRATNASRSRPQRHGRQKSRRRKSRRRCSSRRRRRRPASGATERKSYLYIERRYRRPSQDFLAARSMTKKRLSLILIMESSRFVIEKKKTLLSLSTQRPRSRERRPRRATAARADTTAPAQVSRVRTLSTPLPPRI